MEILRRPEVERMTKLSKPTIYRLIRQGRFPQPLQLSSQAVGWLKHEVVDWIATRERTLGPPEAADVSSRATVVGGGS